MLISILKNLFALACLSHYISADSGSLENMPIERERRANDVEKSNELMIPLILVIDPTDIDFHKPFQPSLNDVLLVRYIEAYYVSTMKSVNKILSTSFLPYKISTSIHQIIQLPNQTYPWYNVTNVTEFLNNFRLHAMANLRQKYPHFKGFTALIAHDTNRSDSRIKPIFDSYLDIGSFKNSICANDSMRYFFALDGGPNNLARMIIQGIGHIIGLNLEYPQLKTYVRHVMTTRGGSFTFRDFSVTSVSAYKTKVAKKNLKCSDTAMNYTHVSNYENYKEYFLGSVMNIKQQCDYNKYQLSQIRNQSVENCGDILINRCRIACNRKCIKDSVLGQNTFNIYAQDGTVCGENKICFNNQCVDAPKDYYEIVDQNVTVNFFKWLGF